MSAYRHTIYISWHTHSHKHINTHTHTHTIYRSSHTHAHKYTNDKYVINPSSCDSPFHDGSHTIYISWHKHTHTHYLQILTYTCTQIHNLQIRHKSIFLWLTLSWWIPHRSPHRHLCCSDPQYWYPGNLQCLKKHHNKFHHKKHNYYYWSLLYSAILRCWADSLRSHVTLHEWIAFYSAFLNIHQSGVFTVLAWQCNQHLKTNKNKLHHLLHSISL